MDPDAVGSGAARPAPRPTAPTERVATLDVLRGFAILGILLVNIELFRGADLYRALAGELTERTGADRWVDAVVGALALGKFLSSFALLFGAGAAIMIGRARAAGYPPRPLLARRFAWLVLFGLLHMVLLFSGDILFLYGVTGFVLLAFAFSPPRTALTWAAGLLAISTVALVAATAAAPEPAPGDPLAGFFADRAEGMVAAYTDGGVLEQVQARAADALIIQSNQLVLIPWVLGLFLLGFAFARAGLLERLGEHRRLLGWMAVVGIGAGVPANLPLGLAGTVGVWSASAQPGGAGLAMAQMLAAPLLAVGYLSALAWVCQRPRLPRWLHPLRQTGRMALSAYLLQSVLCTGVFVGLDQYDRISAAESLVVVVAVWVTVLLACTLWLRRFAMGPAEHLWRTLTYGRRAWR